jgi:hypothetical protein
MRRSSCLNEAYGSHEKYWLVYIRVLAVNLFNVHFIFFYRWLSSSSRMSRSCRCIPPLTSPIPWRWKDVGRQDWCEVSPGLLPANDMEEKPSGFKSGEYGNQSSRIALRTSWWSWQCGPALKTPEDVFSIRRCRPLGPGTKCCLKSSCQHDLFASRNQLLAA